MFLAADNGLNARVFEDLVDAVVDAIALFGQLDAVAGEQLGQPRRGRVTEFAPKYFPPFHPLTHRKASTPHVRALTSEMSTNTVNNILDAPSKRTLANRRNALKSTGRSSRGPESTAAGQGNAWRSDCAGARALESHDRHEARIARTLFNTTAEFDMLQARRLKRNKDEDTFVAKESRAWIFLSNALNHYRAIEKEKEAQQQEEELEAEVEEPEQEEAPQPITNTTTSKMALNWQDDPIPEFYPSEPSRESMNRNQALRDFAASIGQPFPVFTDDEDEEQAPE